MSGFILASKIGQSQTFDAKGKRIPVTQLKAETCFLIDIKTQKNDGYTAVKLSFGSKKRNPKPVLGELKKSGITTPVQKLTEIRVKDASRVSMIEEDGKKGLAIGEQKIMIGEAMNPTILFAIGDMIQVSGISKGKGFQGVVKRHNFRGGPRTHGQSDRERAPGSMGQGTTPGHTYKGKKMAGRMGNDLVTVKGLSVVSVDDKQLIVKGVVPGVTGAILKVQTQTW